MFSISIEVISQKSTIPDSCLDVLFMKINTDPNFEDHALSSKIVYGTGNETYKNEIDIHNLLKTMTEDLGVESVYIQKKCCILQT